MKFIKCLKTPETTIIMTIERIYPLFLYTHFQVLALQDDGDIVIGSENEFLESLEKGFFEFA
jgi:hypothetical protein